VHSRQGGGDDHGSWRFSTTGAASLAANISTTNNALTIGGGLTLAEASAVTLGSAGGLITLSGAVDGTAGEWRRR